MTVVCNDFKAPSVKVVSIVLVVLEQISALPIFVLSDMLIDTDNTNLGMNVSIFYDKNYVFIYL